MAHLNRISVLLSVLLVALVVVLALTARPPAAHAQEPADPQLEVPLYNGVIAVRTASSGRPTVRVYGPDGTRRIEVTPAGQRPANGRWEVPLRNEGDEAAVVVRPGQRIEVDLDSRLTSVTVPEIRARVDSETDQVTGQVPAGSPGVWIQMHRDASWLDGPENPEGASYPVEPDGRFTVSLSGRFDVRPGTWGDVVTVDGRGHVFASAFAPPSATLQLAQAGDLWYYYTVVLTDPTAAPVVSVRDENDLEIFRSGPAIRLGGPQFAVVMAEGGDVQSGLFIPEPGQRLLVLEEGNPVVDEPLPAAAVSIDLQAQRLEGIAPPEARVALTVRTARPGGGGAPQTAAGVLYADATGHFSASLQTLDLTATAEADAVVNPGGAVASATMGRVLAQSVTLYGNRLTGTIAGRGRATVEHRTPGGETIARRTVEVDPVGGLTTELYTVSGDRPLFAPGDALVVTPEIGPALTLTVPALTAQVDEDGRVLRGRAPAGSALSARVYPEPPAFFDPEPYERDYLTVEGRSAADGTYDLHCETEDCAMRYGLVTASEGAARYTLQWLAGPRVGVGVTLLSVLGEATAGLAVTLTPIDAEGQPGDPLSGIVRPTVSGGLPQLSLNLADRYPEGMGEGDRLRVEIGEERIDVTVPAFTWSADVARNAVSGTAPPLRPVVVIAQNYVDASRPGAAAAQATADARGQWQARFGGFNMKPGDDLSLYLPYERHFLWWVEEGIQGIEPTPRPSPVPTATRAPSPTTPAQVPFQLYLPLAPRTSP